MIQSSSGLSPLSAHLCHPLSTSLSVCFLDWTAGLQNTSKTVPIVSLSSRGFQFVYFLSLADVFWSASACKPALCVPG